MAADTVERGHVIQNPNQPLEVRRTLHSFDPCTACAAHLTDETGEGSAVRVVWQRQPNRARMICGVSGQPGAPARCCHSRCVVAGYKK
jgi:hypothetical protein